MRMLQKLERAVEAYTHLSVEMEGTAGAATF